MEDTQWFILTGGLGVTNLANYVTATFTHRQNQSASFPNGCETRSPKLELSFCGSREGMPSRRAISRVEIPAENFKRMISRTWRIATLSAGIIAPLGLAPTVRRRANRCRR